MIIEYLEFDINEQGKGLMLITCTDGSYWHYIACGVFNNKGLKFDLNACELLGMCNSDGVEPPDVVASFTPAREYLEQCLAADGVKTRLKDEYHKVFGAIKSNKTYVA